jgi:hypothetical protein
LHLLPELFAGLSTAAIDKLHSSNISRPTLETSAEPAQPLAVLPLSALLASLEPATVQAS